MEEASRGGAVRTRDIIVGTDGTASSKAAVRWAAREADRRHLPLRIVHAFDWDWDEARYDIGGQYLDFTRRVAAAVTATAFDQAREVAPNVKIEMSTPFGRAAAKLLTLTDDAELMVLGNRGRGGFASLLLGSVSQRVAVQARCPVVIVRGRGDVTDGPIAVGVDDSAAADHVLETAFEAATSRDSALVIIRTYLPSIPLWLRNVPATAVDTPDQDDEDRARLDELVTPWRSKYPDVQVGTVLSHDSAAAVLAGASHGAQFVIVGSHRHGAVASAMLGSTGMQLLHHADCPVYIARPHPRQDPGR